MSSELAVINEARSELQAILDAGAKALKQPGIELMPIKREMLALPDDATDLILDACNLLFAACLSYEGAQWTIDRADNPVELVSARIEQGRSIGVVESLFYGPTAALLLAAHDRAPIAFFALAKSSPDLRIIDRVSHKLIPHRHP
jgi:hypothetical protein